MSSSRQEKPTVSRWDAAALALFALAGAAIVITTIIGAVIRIGEVLPGTNVPVHAVFNGTPAEAPIGPGGDAVIVELESATLIAPTLPAASVGALVIQQLVLVAAVTLVVGALLWLSINIIRQRVFSPTNTVLVAVAGFAGLAGAFLVPFFGNMGANGAFAQISAGTFDNVILQVEIGPYILAAFVVAVACLAFTVGQRLQRDTEGLV
ncbi:hypothetical protein [Microbacterium album]|uniref:DUF2975 domain-containing protein n=1 Tax=Microbacterium album TaxID=2053191 RepID=A0A917IHQ1_9MICO|nr:hypothetical protein [Microbacterium album]GGH47081.1 hypothetical protein GCM10010921_23570 [Microbacterium album]